MSNVDHAEIAKFEALAHRWWDRESEFKPLHDINPLRVNWIDERVGLAGKKVLDVGCGGGILSESMAQRGATVTGIDMGEAPLAVLTELAEKRYPVYAEADITVETGDTAHHVTVDQVIRALTRHLEEQAP